MHVNVYANWPTGWTFSTESDHVFYPGKISFSMSGLAGGAPKNMVFSVDLDGYLNGLSAEFAGILGLGDFEDETWKNLADRIQQKICK
jgi:hypothetical protein